MPKFMNNHYGLTRIFYAPDGGGGGNPGEGGEDHDEGGEDEGDDDDTSERLKTLEAELEKAKKSAADAKKEAAKHLKELREKMSQEEIDAEEKRSKDEQNEKRIKELESELRKNNYSRKYMAVGMDEKTAEEMAELTVEVKDEVKFFASLSKFIKASGKKAGEDAVAEIIKKNPEINSGNGDPEDEPIAIQIAKNLFEGGNTSKKDEILKRYI